MPFSVEGKNRLAHYWKRSEDEVMEWGIQRAKPSPTSAITWRIFKRADWWKSINLINVTDEELEWIMAFYIMNKKEEGDLAGLNERLRKKVHTTRMMAHTRTLDQVMKEGDDDEA